MHVIAISSPCQVKTELFPRSLAAAAYATMNMLLGLFQFHESVRAFIRQQHAYDSDSRYPVCHASISPFVDVPNDVVRTYIMYARSIRYCYMHVCVSATILSIHFPMLVGLLAIA